MLRRLPLLLLVLLVAACTGASSTTTTLDGSTTSLADGVTTTEGDGSTTTTAPASTSTTAPDLSGIEGISDEVRAQLEELIRRSQEVRGLPFLSPPNIRVVSSEELQALVVEDLQEVSEDFPADEALYKMLGLLNEAADFEQIIYDLYGEQVAGFYDGETGEIVVPARDDGFSVLQQSTMVHELVHALTDQHFDFHSKYTAMIDEERLDEAGAYQALIEGDATLATALWAQSLSQRELGEFIAESLDVDTAALDRAPRFLRESLVFPYDTGLGFVQTLYIQGDWAAVNAAYEELAAAPGSTEQVITPDDYTRDLPVEVAIPEIDLPGYQLERTSVWGEQGFRVLLNQGTTAPVMARATDGWGGDSYHQWYDGENAALLIVFEGDTTTDETELEEALLAFALDSFPEEHFAWVEELNGSIYFIAADDPLVGERIRAAAGLD